MNTSVLSSIFLKADLVVRGNLMMAYWSSLFLPEMHFRGYLGCLQSHGALGHQKVNDSGSSNFFLQLWKPFSTALPSKPLLCLQLREGQGLPSSLSAPSS